MRQVLLLINPASRRGQSARPEVARALESRGLQVVEASEENPQNFGEIIRRFASRIDMVVVGGGDGTIRSVLPELMETKLPLGVIPLGTANNLSRNLGIPQSLDGACDTIGQGATRLISIGRVNGQLFLNVAGLGLSSQINLGIPKDLKRKLGVMAYAIWAMKVFRRTQSFHAEVVVDGKATRVRALQITVCNGRFYGAGMTISPDATIEDDYLDLISTEVEHWWNGLLLLPTMWKGTHDPAKGVQVFRGKEIEIRTRRKLWIDTDGEVTTFTPAHFSIQPQALRVMVPQVAASDTEATLRTPAQQPI